MVEGESNHCENEHLALLGIVKHAMCNAVLIDVVMNGGKGGKNGDLQLSVLRNERFFLCPIKGILSSALIFSSLPSNIADECMISL